MHSTPFLGNWSGKVAAAATSTSVTSLLPPMGPGTHPLPGTPPKQDPNQNPSIPSPATEPLAPSMFEHESRFFGGSSRPRRDWGQTRERGLVLSWPRASRATNYCSHGASSTLGFRYETSLPSVPTPLLLLHFAIVDGHRFPGLLWLVYSRLHHPRRR